MLKNNFPETLKRFDDWWARKAGTILVIADISRPGPVFTGISEFANMETAHSMHLEYLKAGAFYGDAIPDMSSYLGPGSLCTFLGSLPIYSDNTIWFKEGCTTSDEFIQNCVDFINSNSTSVFDWYKWSLQATRYYKEHSNDQYMTSMPDLQQNLDIVAAVMGVDRMFIEIMDNPKKIHELLEILYKVWEKGFLTHWELLVTVEGYSAYTSYNIAGRGKTSVLQSDISCMMSCDMFDEFEYPYLKKQCEILDNVIYHLDGPGAVRHIDSILTIDKINAVQWVPGAGNPGNADECWFDLYDKILQKEKGLYVFLWPDEIDGFLDRYGSERILIRTRAESAKEQIQLVDKYSK